MAMKAFTLAELAEMTNSRLIGNPTHRITNVASLESASQEDASFLAISRYTASRYDQAMVKSQAGVIFIAPTTSPIEGRNFLVNEDPSRAFQQLVETFHEEAKILSSFQEIHPTAIIHESCKLGKNVTIGPFVVLDQNVTVDDDTFIGSHCYVGPFSIIGKQCILHPQVTIRERCTLGNRVILQPGAVIGSCGFGYTTDAKGRHTKLNQVGVVIIEDDVEIGANTTIDRSRFKSTLIKRGTKIDNLVQIGHGAIIGEDNIIVAQSGIAGSAETGKNVVLAGQTAIAGHLKIAAGVILSARTGASKSITEAGKYGGVPAVPIGEYNRKQVFLRNIETYVEEIKNLRTRIKKLEEAES
jgi:UDP-3-O-[3-hydroxymyristoyl] glucosamine N-acyltransferase